MKESDSSPSHLRLYSLLTLMVVLWAANFVVARFVLREFPALLAASLRAFFAGLVLVPVYLYWGRRENSVAIQAREIPYLLLLGIFGVTLNQVLFLTGYERTSTGHAAILVGLTPLLVLLVSVGAGLERLTGRRVAGMAVAITGIVVLQMARGAAGTATLFGDALVVLASFAFAIFAVLGKKMTARHGGLTINTFAFVGGGLSLAPVVLWHLRSFDFTRVSAKAWAGLGYMAMFPSALCYLIFYWALRHIPASRVSNFGYLQPLFALFFGSIFLGDPVHSSIVAGGSLLLTGVYLAERSQ